MAARGGGDADAEDLRQELSGLRARDLKQQLKDMGVDSSDIFEKDEFIDRIVDARLNGGGAAGADQAADAEAPVPDDPPLEEDAGAATSTKQSEVLEKCRALKVKELRTELGTRGMPWADCLEKEELVQRLAAVMAEEAEFSNSGRFTPGNVVQLSGSELEEELRDGSSPLLLDVFATWCGPCQFMAPQLASAAATLGGRVRVAKMDSDENPDMATRLKVGGLPTIILFGRDGKELTRQEGAVMEQQLIDMVSRAGA